VEQCDLGNHRGGAGNLERSFHADAPRDDVARANSADALRACTLGRR
jgi:hypothetical protein